LSRALGVVLRDVVLTSDEIRGLTAGLLVSHQPALGRVSFLEWLQENASTLGRAYADETRPTLPRAQMISALAPRRCPRAAPGDQCPCSDVAPAAIRLENPRARTAPPYRTSLLPA
jgi:hypothetical protein